MTGVYNSRFTPVDHAWDLENAKQDDEVTCEPSLINRLQYCLFWR
jgi:hypothetical protein